MFHSNAGEPAALIRLAINDFAQEKRVVRFNLHQREWLDWLTEPNLRTTLAYIAYLAGKNLTGRPNQDQARGAVKLLALLISLFAPLIADIRYGGFLDQRRLPHVRRFAVSHVHFYGLTALNATQVSVALG